MSYYARQWMQWTDRIVVIVAVACLFVGLSVAQAQTSVLPGNDDRIERSPPVPLMTFSDPRGNAVTVIENDGTVRFDYGATITWSRHFVGSGWSVPKCAPVQVLTWVNTTTGRQPLFLQGCMPVQPKDAP